MDLTDVMYFISACHIGPRVLTNDLHEASWAARHDCERHDACQNLRDSCLEKRDESHTRARVP